MLAVIAFGFSSAMTIAQEPLEGIRPTPLTRPEMKRMLEDVKVRVPRIPLPELSDQDRAQLGDQADSYEARVKHHYLGGIEPPRQTRSQAPGGGGFNAARSQDPAFTLDNALKVELFWIVSRVNNCQYCIGHQESKLLGLGRSEDQIAMLDCEWEKFPPASQEAFAFARKYTLEPHRLDDEDILRLKKHFTDAQILEMMLSMAGNNSINRWKEAIAVPQHADGGGFSSRFGGTIPASDTPDPNRPSGSYMTPTSPLYASKQSKIVVTTSTKETGVTCPTKSPRPELESREFVEKMLLQCKSRSSRLPLVDESQARETIPAVTSIHGKLPNWIRLLARFTAAGGSRIETTLAADFKGDLSPLTKAQLGWILARQDRAWYALGRAREELRRLGQTDDQIFALDGDWNEFAPRDRAIFRVAKKLGDSPVVLPAKDVKDAVELAGPRDVVQVVSYTTSRAAFNRLTEAAGLPLE